MSYYPKSLTRLILVGLVLILLPLAFAFYNVASSLELLAGRGQRAVFEAVRITQHSILLIQRITEMERAARQYLIIEDRALLDGYVKLHDEVQTAAQTLSVRALDVDQREKLKELISIENRLFGMVQGVPNRPFKVKQYTDFFSQLSQLSQLGESILAQSDMVIGREAEALMLASNQARETLSWQLFAPIPLAMLFSFMFTVLITQPFRQIIKGIRRIGDGELITPIVVQGPQDLVDLGKRLDWLRQRLYDLQEKKTQIR